MHEAKVEAHFTSTATHGALRNVIIDRIQSAVAEADGRETEINIMMFAFTDGVIGEFLISTARANANVQIRLIADWKQGSPGVGSQVRVLIKENLKNVAVRYKADQPYLWDSEQQLLRWSYHVSRGMLHHKTVSIRISGKPRLLICGTYNWTKAATSNYENVLVFEWDQKKYRSLITRLDLEFESLWCDGLATLSPTEAKTHYELILECFLANPGLDPSLVEVVPASVGGAPLPDNRPHPAVDKFSTGDSACIAFSSKRYSDERAGNGYARENFEQMITTKNGRRRPFTLNQLSLMAINDLASGEHLYIAMHGLSTHVPEFSAIIESARRGVKCDLILDGRTSAISATRLAEIAAAESLPLQVSTTSRFMHQKYMVLKERNTVITGTANMSTDATTRHSEHRILLRDEPLLAASFLSDFEKIKNRIQPLSDKQCRKSSQR